MLLACQNESLLTVGVGILMYDVYDVTAEAGDPLIKPKAQNIAYLGVDLGIVPIKIGLLL